MSYSIQVVTFDYGMGDENPIDHMRFYLKNNLQKAVKVRKDQVRCLTDCMIRFSYNYIQF